MGSVVIPAPLVSEVFGRMQHLTFFLILLICSIDHIWCCKKYSQGLALKDPIVNGCVREKHVEGANVCTSKEIRRRRNIASQRAQNIQMPSQIGKQHCGTRTLTAIKKKQETDKVLPLRLRSTAPMWQEM